MLTGMVSIPHDPPASASQSAGITGLSHCARPQQSFYTIFYSALWKLSGQGQHWLSTLTNILLNSAYYLKRMTALAMYFSSKHFLHLAPQNKKCYLDLLLGFWILLNQPFRRFFTSSTSTFGSLSLSLSFFFLFIPLVISSNLTDVNTFICWGLQDVLFPSESCPEL